MFALDPDRPSVTTPRGPAHLVTRSIFSERMAVDGMRLGTFVLQIIHFSLRVPAGCIPESANQPDDSVQCSVAILFLSPKPVGGLEA